jgi:hypothetical protein
MKAMWQRLPKFKIGLLLAAVIAVANVPGELGDPHIDKWQSGDIVFLNGTSFRSRAVRLLQGYSCDFSHVGMVVVEDGVPFIVNADPAEGKVIKQRWDAVIAPGQVSGGAVYRVRHADSQAVDAACETAQRYAREGIPFDNDFDLKTPDRLFCTELVLRAYQNAGIDLCKNAETEHPHLLPADLLGTRLLEQISRF